jgi:hypothetical protein
MSEKSTQENKISINVCKVMEFKDAHYFQAVCSCANSAHTQDFSISVETISYGKENLNAEVSLQIDSQIYSEEFSGSELRNAYYDAMENGDYYRAALAKLRLFLSNVKNKISLTWQLWTKGHIKANSYFTFRNAKAIDDYVFAITSAKKQCEDFLKNGK